MFCKLNIALRKGNVNNIFQLFDFFSAFYLENILIFLFFYGSLVKNR